jgi:hypothetical protein
VSLFLDDGDVRLYHGDALEQLRQLPDGCVDMVATGRCGVTGWAKRLARRFLGRCEWGHDCPPNCEWYCECRAKERS